jgi:hypothetical protein
VKQAPANEPPADVTAAAPVAIGEAGPAPAKRTGKRAPAKKAAAVPGPEAATPPATTARRAKKAPADRPAAIRKSTPAT